MEEIKSDFSNFAEIQSMGVGTKTHPQLSSRLQIAIKDATDTASRQKAFENYVLERLDGIFGRDTWIGTRIINWCKDKPGRIILSCKKHIVTLIGNFLVKERNLRRQYSSEIFITFFVYLPLSLYIIALVSRLCQ